MEEELARWRGGGSVAGHGIDACKEEKIASFLFQRTTSGYLPQA
jgi:hypothetical protein